jgi:serine/threonine-protein kinase
MVIEGKYELIRLIGEGGMGEVYEGRHRVIGRRVAVKFLRGEYARDPQVALRFENEAKVAGGSEHENIASVHDVGALADGTRYSVMEFLDGEDVDKLVRREAPLSIARSAFIVIQACRALDAVHQRGIVHRDLKPANLFLARRTDNTDLVKVLDFGIAKLKTTDGQSGTKTGTAIGTAHYMSPEQARGERAVDTRSDVYSLGVILYELLSGKKPYDGESLLQILHKVMTQPPIPLGSVRPGLPDALHAVVRRAMAADVAERYATVAEFGDALLPFAGRALTPIRPQSAALVPATVDAGETRTSASSALGVHPAPEGTSVTGVVRTKVNALDSAPAESPRTSRRFPTLLVGGISGALASMALLAIVAASIMRASPKPVRPVAETSAAPAVIAPVEFLAPTPIGSSVQTRRDVTDASTSPTFMPAATVSVRPSGHRTLSSEHSAMSAPVAAPTPEAVPTPPPTTSATAVAPAPTAVAPKKPTASDRSDNPF